ncbi:MAG: hypothetical protein ABIT01_03350 [Thermoanaerobaculia bacterium]
MSRITAALLGFALLGGSALAEERTGTLSVVRHIPLDQIQQRAVGPLAVDPLAIYSNVTTNLGTTITQGAAAGGITRLVMDDLTFTTNPGVSNVTTVRFSVFNGNATTQSVRARIRFWNADSATMIGTVPGPGTYYAPGGAGTEVGFSFAAFSFAPGITILAGNLGAGFAVPAGATTTLWAGLTFDNVGTTTAATNTELSLFGQVAFGPVDLGSSTAGGGFETTAAGSFFTTANPAGAAATFGGSPAFNLGWEFVVTTLPVQLQHFAAE